MWYMLAEFVAPLLVLAIIATFVLAARLLWRRVRGSHSGRKEIRSDLAGPYNYRPRTDPPRRRDITTSRCGECVVPIHGEAGNPRITQKTL